MGIIIKYLKEVHVFHDDAQKIFRSKISVRLYHPDVLALKVWGISFTYIWLNSSNYGLLVLLQLRMPIRKTSLPLNSVF